MDNLADPMTGYQVSQTDIIRRNRSELTANPAIWQREREIGIALLCSSPGLIGLLCADKMWLEWEVSQWCVRLTWVSCCLKVVGGFKVARRLLCSRFKKVTVFSGCSFLKSEFLTKQSDSTHKDKVTAMFKLCLSDKMFHTDKVTSCIRIVEQRNDFVDNCDHSHTWQK